MRKFVVIAAMTAVVGTASAGSITPAGCSTCTLDAQLYTGGATPFTLVNLGTATIPNARQPIASPITVSGETITFPDTGSGVYAGNGGVCNGGIGTPFPGTNTNYLAAIPCDSGVTITFAAPQHQFNLLWGSVDPDPPTYNQITFNFSDGAQVVNGADVVAAAGNSVIRTNAIVEIVTQKPFTSVTLSASEASFEFIPGVPVAPVFAGTPGKTNCHGKSVSALAQQYGGLNAAAAALDFASVQALQDAIMSYCGE